MAELTSLAALDSVPHAEVFETPRPRTIRLRLEAEEQIPPHQHPGTDVVLYLVDGRLELSLNGEEYRMNEGDLIRFSGDQDISPTAIDPSTAILVFAKQPDPSREGER